MKDVGPTTMPKARQDRLIIKELPDETLVYDLDSDKAHCLNDTAALVWKSCDGIKSVNEIQTELTLKAGAPVDENVVWLALAQLEKFKLLSEAATQPKFIAGMSRRKVMRSFGVAAIALPAVVSILVPTPAHALSCVQAGDPPGSGCGNPGQCCSNVCSSTPPKTCQ
jgi:Coenzyme PQQ synthesis protein D (PqqD)